ncbi:MAG: winged helix DNA-binding protein [Clostridiales bacterium]|nr:winged helix DNA-binding protein [Clostridiales bacterium]MDY5515519.1 winged helix DNA-binding protein [Candidatus Ventricola sp.]
MTSILSALERQGLLKRTVSTTDRRRVIVTLTDDGRTLVQDHDAQQLERISSLLDLLGEEDAKACTRILDKVLLFEQSIR